MILVQAIARLGFSFLQPGSRNFQFQVQFVGECDDFNQFHQFTIPINNKTSRNAHSFSTLNNEFQSISNIIHNLLDCKNYRYLRAVFVYTQFIRPGTRPKTFLQCFALDSCCAKAKHCRNVLGHVLGLMYCAVIS